MPSKKKPRQPCGYRYGHTECVSRGLYDGLCWQHRKAQDRRSTASASSQVLRGLYVVEVNPTRVKVGRSTDPEARIRTHQTTSRLYAGYEGGRSWYIRCDTVLESAALTAVAQLTPPIGREFFDADFDDVVEIVEGIVRIFDA